MKRYYELIPVVGLALSLGACADHFDTNSYSVEKPASLAEYEYLNDYKPLKEYIDRNAHPGFLLGTGVTASEYIKGEGVYILTNTNFDQITAGNAMKYASVVADNGAMNFGTVSDFVNAAEAAGIQVYGHTLCWHEQQNVKWLNSLIADKKIEIDPNEKKEVVDYEIDYSKETSYNFWHQSPEGTVFSINKEEGCLQIDNPAAVNFWEVQYFTCDNITLKKGETYQLTVTLRGSQDGAVQGNFGGWGDNVGIRIPYTTEWETKTIDIVSATDGTSHGLFQTGDLAGTIQYKSIKISHLETPAVAYFESLISNGDMEGDEVANFFVTQPSTGGPNPAVLTAGAGVDGSKGVVIESGDNPANSWDTQFFLKSNTKLYEGDKLHISFKYRADLPAGSESQSHGNPGAYIHWDGGLAVNFTPDWQTFDKMITIDASKAGGDGMQTFAWNLSVLKNANKYYFDDIVMEIERTGNTVPLTPEEKAEVLTAEMERWVKGMMEATEGKVKAWDVVNEPISGGPWGQRYDLQHAATASGDQSNKFYWQDYLGDNFVRIPVKFARQYFEENGGNPADLKLFVNDYNLESDWDDNQKLKSLISWIEQWESDGVTKIDGIGSQMHVSYSMNATTQKSREDHVVKMFELMASSGKLCRITELDMGIQDADGNTIKTSDITFEQHKAMAEYYNFIVKKYFEIIPVAQQYGICAWAQTDSPEGSGWRAGEPIGLWNLNYSRKPAYGGFADGLQGK